MCRYIFNRSGLLSTRLLLQCRLVFILFFFSNFIFRGPIFGSIYIHTTRAYVYIFIFFLVDCYKKPAAILTSVIRQICSSIRQVPLHIWKLNPACSLRLVRWLIISVLLNFLHQHYDELMIFLASSCKTSRIFHRARVSTPIRQPLLSISSNRFDLFVINDGIIS